MTSISLEAQIAELTGELCERQRGPRRLPVSQAAELCAPGEILAATEAGRPMAVACLADGALVLIPDNCPHDGGLLSDGFVEGQQIVCARHGWEFDGHSGKCLQKTGVQLPCRRLSGARHEADS